jgi:predicted phage baseplate assembly protein
MADNRTTHLRFGDGYFGQRPALGTDFSATYRLGSGRSGNVGAEAIAHLVLATEDALGDLVLRLGNPLPATGGIDPETLLQARLDAPQAFRVQQRAVTAEDYAAIAARHPQVQQAQATRRWTGSWYTWFLTVDRKGGLPIDVEFEQDLRQFLNQFRLAGYDLEIDAPRFVPLEIVFSVRTQPGYYPANVRASLLKVFSNQDYAPGQQGFFHPDQFTFGQPVYLSQVVATAMAVPGVQWVNFGTTDPRHRFQRWGQVTNQELDQGAISLKRLEIARLDNDPNAPENGRLNFLMEGGR